MLNIQSGIEYVTHITGSITVFGNKTMNGIIYLIQEAGKETYEDEYLTVTRFDDGTFSLEGTGIDEAIKVNELDALTLAQLDVADLNAQNRRSEIEKAAQERANGDTILERILRVAMSYATSLEVAPTIEQGIEFFKVGHNASHDFFLGRLDGQTYRMSYGESLNRETNDFEYKSSISLVEGDNFGYCGHF